jgi:hypothetical protein
MLCIWFLGVQFIVLSPPPSSGPWREIKQVSKVGFIICTYVNHTYLYEVSAMLVIAELALLWSVGEGLGQWPIASLMKQFLIGRN